MEKRFSTELRATGRKLEGYAATFGRETRIADFQEVILPGAFNLRGDVLALVDHSPEKLLARTRSKTLRLSQDKTGLHFELDLPETSLGRDVLALAERGDLGGMSFGFTVNPGGERWQGKRRELRSLKLYEISVVCAWPAYDGTVVSARCRTPRLNMALRTLEVLA
ncbi:MAG: HK97 family phage prohead protease [Desulfovibrio sp.]|nr:HK97 family phage prohead protease [Desulfovibrio sp.]